MEVTHLLDQDILMKKEKKLETKKKVLECLYHTKGEKKVVINLIPDTF